MVVKNWELVEHQEYFDEGEKFFDVYRKTPSAD